MSTLIKKYRNRRLYDTEISQYITVDQLLGYVLKGKPFHVQDVSNGNDITGPTLLQILVETEAGATQFLSPYVLTQLIMLAHHPMNETFKKMLEQFFQSFDKNMRDNPYLNNLQESSTAWQQHMQDLVKQWQGFFK